MVAPLLAAALGIGGGVLTALALPGEEPEPRADPLGLGIELVEQACTGDSLLVVGYGDSVAQLGTAASSNAGARYLRSDESCDTVLGPERAPTPAYVVYLGPYDRLQEPCGTRMTPEHRADFVTRLRSGNEQLVKCPCVLPPSTAPELRVGMDADATDVVWIRSLQAMLGDLDRERFPHDQITGEYDEFTADRVAELQAEAPGRQTTPGVVDTATWEILTDRICRSYDF